MYLPNSSTNLVIVHHGLSLLFWYNTNLADISLNILLPKGFMLYIVEIVFSSDGSQEHFEPETTLASPPSIIHHDVAKWVEPVGGGRRFEDERQVKRVGIIGTGDFGRALAGKMVQAGYKVTIGSRNPDRNRLVLEEFYYDFY